MSIRHVHRTAARLLTGLVLGSAAAVALSGVAGADLTSGQQVSGADTAVAPFTAGTPFSSGQGINVVLPTNTLFAPTKNLNVLECAAPGGVPPTNPADCDGLTINSPTLKPNADGSVNFKTKTGQLYPVYALPDANLGEGSSSPVVCNLTNECVLYIGQNQNDFTQPHVWSPGFFIAPNSTDSGANPGDGSPAAYSTTVTAAPTSSVTGQSVTFTDTIAPSSSACVPSGTVTFSDGSGTLGAGTITGDSASYTTSSLAVGGYTITADWPGNTSCPGDYPSTTTFSVGADGSSTSLTANPTTALVGQKVTLTATVTAAAPGSGTPTGTVTFSDAAGTIGTATLSGGTATLNTTSLPLGADSVTAAYNGGSAFSGSTSSAVTVTVTKASTTTSLAASPATSSVYGESVTLTATVGGTGSPTGTVTFSDVAGTLGTGTVSGGKATFSTSSLAVGSYSFTATYGGDANNSGSSSSALAYSVAKASTTTVDSGPGTVVYGQSVTISATVAPVSPGAGTPTGTVTFGSLGTGTLSGGKASVTTSSLPVGTTSVAISYGGDGNFSGSTGNTVSVTVNKAGTSSTLSSSAPTAAPGVSVTFTDTVVPVAPGAGTPTGTVAFMDGSTTLGTGTLSGGKATFSTSSLAIGSHSITAVYGGDGNFSGSTSNTVTQTVLQVQTVLTGTPQISINPLKIILPSVQATLKTAAGVPIAGQTITFTAGSTTLCSTTTSSAGVATCTPPLLDEVDIILNLGVHESFGGNSIYEPSSASTSIIEL